MIKIGPIRETDRRFCREDNLDWVSTFTALGINYDVKNIRNITVQNIENKIESMQKSIQLWTHPNITPMGRICIAKSLILSKIIHVLQSLPTPPLDYLKRIEKMIINFIWKNKRHEINKQTLYLEHKIGGLNMLDIIEFDQSLKLTWVRKLLSGEHEWSNFAKESKIDRLTNTDENYHQVLYLSIKNPFWRSVAHAYKNWYPHLKERETVDIKNKLLWGNPLIKIPFNNTLYQGNIVYVKDLYNPNGEPLSQVQLERQFGKPIMFTSYYSLWNCLPKIWKNDMLNKVKTLEVYRPPAIDWLTRDKKGTKSIR